MSQGLLELIGIHIFGFVAPVLCNIRIEFETFQSGMLFHLLEDRTKFLRWPKSNFTSATTFCISNLLLSISHELISSYSAGEHEQ